MKKKVLYFVIVLSISVIANYLFVNNFSNIDVYGLKGTYINEGENYIDTLVLFENHSIYRSVKNKRNNLLQRKTGGWGNPILNNLIIENYSFDEANYPVTAKFYRDFFWTIRLEIGLGDNYVKQ